MLDGYGYDAYINVKNLDSLNNNLYMKIGDEEIKLHLYFVKIALLFGLMYVFLTPMFYSVDEEQHMIRSYNVSYGNIIEMPNDKIPWPIQMENEIKY